MSEDRDEPMTREQVEALIVARAKVRQAWQKLAKVVGAGPGNERG